MAAPDTAFVNQYSDLIQMLAQQMDFRFGNAISIDNNFKGEKKFVEQYASDDMVEIITRYADTPIQLPDHRRRVLFPSFFVSNTLEDPKDALQMLVDPKSTYMQAKMAAANRKKDDVVIAAALGTAYTGKAGTTSQAITLSVASGSVGLTKAKVLEAKQDLDEGEVELEDRYFAHSAQQLNDLLNTTEVTSSDYNVVKALVQGELSTWVGFQWIRTERLATDAASARRCIAWQKKGIVLGIQKDVEGRITERPDKNYAWQVYNRMCVGATRLEEARVVEVLCAE